ncbi:MAG: hypothetical protein EB130_07390, partial [Actinobacteria bacterium]|nr:hypothetical protein [Actinomycetota bacterium]
MFKVGSKLFLGTTGFAAVNLVAYLIFVERLAIGGVALSMLFAALIGVSAAVLMINDGDDETQPRDTALTRASMWPLIAAVGLVLLVLGLVVSQLYFIFGGIVLVAALAEWMVQAMERQFGIEVVNYFGSNEGASLVAAPMDVPDRAQRAIYFPRVGVPGYEWTLSNARKVTTRLVDVESGEDIHEPGR